MKLLFEQSLKQQLQQGRIALNKAVDQAIKAERFRMSQSINMNKQQIDKNFEYIAGRMRDLDNKIRVIVQNQDAINDQTQTNMKNSKLFMHQLNQIKKQFIEGCQNDVNIIKQKILKSISQKQIKIHFLETQISKVVSYNNSNEQLLKNLFDKFNMADQFKLLKQVAQKVTNMLDTSNMKPDLSKLTPLQQQLVMIKNALQSYQIQKNIELRNISQQITDFNSTVIALASKSSSQNTKLLELQSINQRLTARVKDFQKKNFQLEETTRKLTKKTSDIQTQEQQYKTLTKKNLLAFEQLKSKNYQLERKIIETQGLLERKTRCLDQSSRKNCQLQQKISQYINSLKKAQQNLQETIRNHQQIMKKHKFEMSKESENQIIALTYNYEAALKIKSQKDELIVLLNKQLDQRNKRISELDDIHLKNISQIENMKLQNNEMFQTITQLKNKLVNHDQRNQQSSIMIKTQSIRYNEHLQSNVFSSKSSIKSQNQVLSLKKTRSNKIQSSDEDGEILQRHFSSKNMQASNKYSKKAKLFKEDLPEKLLKLKQILKINRKPLPLTCQIDQTGYLKDREEGTYIYGNDGDLFVLNQQEISRAVHHRIINL